MKIELGETKPVSNFVDAAIEFPLKLSYDSFQSPLGVEGLLLAEDKKVLANLSEKSEGLGRNIGSIGARKSKHDTELEKERVLDVSLLALLSKGALNHIDNLRDKNPEGDVAFNLSIRVRTLVSRALTAHLQNIQPPQIGPPVSERLEQIGVSFIGFRPDPRYSSSQENLWVISGAGSPTFLEITDVPQVIPVVIPASYWVLRFAPRLGIGRFAIAELPLLSPVAVGGEFAARLNEAIQALPKMEEKVKEGEWNEVIEKSRPIAELLTKSKDMIKSLLIEKQGYSEEAANALTAVIGSLFDYGSKFVKKTKKEELLLKINAEKEDAYLIYSLSIGLVNLLAQKVRKSESQ